ncbi:MAG TPA: hypothetical protein V6D06_14480 [Trichocoleus sp.]
MQKPYTPQRIAGNCLVFLAVWTVLLLVLHEIRRSPVMGASVTDRSRSHYLLLRGAALLCEQDKWFPTALRKNS